MSVAKVVEITARSNKSFEDAVEQGITKAGDSVRNMKHAWVKDHEVMIEDGKPVRWQVSLKVTFLLD